MRFSPGLINRIRTGKVTATVRRWENRPIGFEAGGYYAIERVDDVRDERVLRAADGTPLEDAHGKLVTEVHYERQVEATDEAICVTARYSEIDGQPTELDRLPADVVKAAGFEHVEDLVEHFRADYGGERWQRVWVVEFEYAGQKPRLLSRPDHGGATRTFRGKRKSGHGDYVGSFSHAIDDLEAVDDETLDAYVAENRKRFEELRRTELDEAEARRLGVKLKELRKRAARTGVDVTLEVAVIRHSLEQIEQKLDRAA